MKTRYAFIILFASLCVSGWFYLGDEIKMEKLLTSTEWQSNMVSLLEDDHSSADLGPLRRVDVNSNVKYLPNGEYVRVSVLDLYASTTEERSKISISERGTWEVSDNYLLVKPEEFKDLSSPYSTGFTNEQLDIIKQIFKMDAEQSRRIDIVNDKTLLLTSLNHGSTVLFRH